MAGTTQPRRTRLYDEHQALGAKIIDFGGWELPASYESVLAEHKAVREAVGVFDVSHMGEVRVSGLEAVKFLQWILVNDITRLSVGQGQYTAMLNPSGGMIDDLIVYRLGEKDYFLCVNAGNDAKDFRWIAEHAHGFDVRVVHESDRWSQLAVQGPRSPAAIKELLGAPAYERVAALAYTGITEVPWANDHMLVARTGYTGEMGYELYVPNETVVRVWKKLLADAPLTGLKPIGLGARDTLRLEACYLLYGNDMNDEVSPIEAGIGWAVKKGDPDFIGRERVTREIKAGPRRKILAFLMEEAGIPRHGMDVYIGERKIGVVTSGSMLPTLNRAGGMAMVDVAESGLDQRIEIDVRGKRKLAKTAKRPLYNAKVK